MNAEAPDAAAAVPSLRRRAWGGSLWTLAGYGFQQALRFGNNLILTRLLFPEAFGLMALTQVFVTALEMLSDVGVGPAVVQSSRGDDPKFLRTAWTFQVVRGLGLALMAAVIAWPVSRIYGEPRLLGLLPAAGLGIALRGFSSIRLFTLHRAIRLGRLTAIETASQAVAVALTVLAAWALRSVWALVLGSLCGVAARVLLSHLLLPGPRDGFQWDREALRELAKVGRWVFISTATTFLVGHLDRLTMGKLLTPEQLGVYTIGLFLAVALPTMGKLVGSRVFFPMLSETLREDRSRLNARFRKMRTLWTLPICAALAGLALAGEPIVRWLYPPKYHDAGWILRVLAAGSIPAVLNQATGVIWPALGDFRMITWLMLAQIGLLFAALLGGHALAGPPGLIAGVALVELAVYPLQAVLVRRRGLWHPGLDLPVLAAAGLLVGLGFRWL